MSNPWFQFKRFRIHQDRCGMKVGTDGVILGAWTSVNGITRVLDVGTGTGVLALMLAQKDPKLRIHAIEIEPDAAAQAQMNVEQSDFSSQILVSCTSFTDFLSTTDTLYDLIVSNPPYYSGSLRPNQEKRSVARHNGMLNLKELISGASKLQNEGGSLSLIIPIEGNQEVMQLAAYFNYTPEQILNIIPAPGKPIKRRCIRFLKERKRNINQNVIEEELILETGERHQYSLDYQKLTEDYYL